MATRAPSTCSMRATRARCSASCGACMGVRLASEVEEVFQETWMRIIAARASFSPQGASLAHLGLHHRAQPGHGPAAPERPRSRLLCPRRGRRRPRSRAPVQPRPAGRGRGVFRCRASLGRGAGLLARRRPAAAGLPGRAARRTARGLPAAPRGRLHAWSDWRRRWTSASKPSAAGCATGCKKLRGCMERYLVVLERRA